MHILLISLIILLLLLMRSLLVVVKTVAKYLRVIRLLLRDVVDYIRFTAAVACISRGFKVLDVPLALISPQVLVLLSLLAIKSKLWRAQAQVLHLLVEVLAVEHDLALVVAVWVLGSLELLLDVRLDAEGVVVLVVGLLRLCVAALLAHA